MDSAGTRSNVRAVLSGTCMLASGTAAGFAPSVRRIMATRLLTCAAARSLERSDITKRVVRSELMVHFDYNWRARMSSNKRETEHTIPAFDYFSSWICELAFLVCPRNDQNLSPLTKYFSDRREMRKSPRIQANSLFDLYVTRVFCDQEVTPPLWAICRHLRICWAGPS
jgi:hypothetical protein